MDSKLGSAQVDPLHDGDVVLLAPSDWTDAEEALCKLAHVASEHSASDKRRSSTRSDFSAGPRMTEPSLDATPGPAERNNAPTSRPSLRRRGSRGLAGFLLTVCVGVAATLAWQSYGDTARQMIASSAPPLGWMLSSVPTDPPSSRESTVGQPYPSAVPAPAPQAAPAQAGVVESTASKTVELTAPVTAAELQQLQTMANDLAAVRQRVEELAAGQEQMARDIAKLQAAGQDLRRRLSALPPAIAPTARKPIPTPQPAPAPFVPAATPSPPQPTAQSSAPPLPPPPPEPPARPPMPLR
jgi:hypothetical protein